MNERLRFIARLLDGEKMADVCADFGISRKTGYKIYERYKHTGVLVRQNLGWGMQFLESNRYPTGTVTNTRTQSFSDFLAEMTAWSAYRIY